MGVRGRGWALVLSAGLLLTAGGALSAEGFRNIASVTANIYFNGDWRVETKDVFLARVLPWLTLAPKLARADSEGWHQYQFYLGPVVSFTDHLYLEAVYGLSVDSDASDGRYSHEADLNFNYETDTTATSVGLRADWFPGTGYYYFIPSVSGKFHPLPALGLFGKFFLSIDSDAVLTESFWGQADYRFSKLFGARLGFTFSQAGLFGYSAAAGLDFYLSPAVALKYTFEYLSDSVEYLTSPQPRSGVSNALVLDWRF